MRAYISNQVKMHAYHLNFETLNNVFCKDSPKKSLMGSIKEKPPGNGQKLEILLKIFSFLRNS
jgi:hypothetical protein